MEPSRNTLSGERYGAPAKKTAVGTGLSSDPAAERITVETVERQIRLRSQQKDYSTSRSRRHQRQEQAGPGRFVWIVVALVAMGYLSFLAFNIATARKIKPTVVPARPLSAATTNAMPKPLAAVPDSVPPVQPPNPPPVVPASDQEPVSVLITRAKAAGQLAEDGRRLLRDQQFARAEIKFEEAMKLSPGGYTVLMDWARALIAQKRWLAARDVLIRAMAADSSSTEMRLLLAQACYELHQPEDALALANWVLESEPYSEGAHQIAADVLTGMAKHDVAMKHLQKLVAIDSNNHVAENNLGMTLIELGQYAQAVRTFENVIRDEPGNSQAYYYMAVCFIKKNEPALAIDVLARASSRFGQQFVQSWTKSPDFDALRNDENFQRQFGEVVVTNEPQPVTP